MSNGALEQAVIAPLVQGGAFLGILLVAISWVLPVRHRFDYKLEMTLTGLCFASVQFRFGALFYSSIPEYFFILFLPSLLLLGPAVFLLTIRTLRLSPRFVTTYKFCMIGAAVALAVFDVMFLHATESKAQPVAAITGQRNTYSVALVIVAVITIVHYLAAFGVFQYQRLRLHLSFGQRAYWLLLGTVAAALLIFTGFLSGINWLFLPGALFFALIVMGMILLQVRYPGLLAYVEKAVEKARYEKTSLQNINLDDVCSSLERLMTNERVYRSPTLRIAELASQLGIHKNQLSRVLNERYGANFNAFVNDRRLAEARQLLRDTDLPIIEVCFDCGFNSLSGFTAAFKKANGKSARHFREAAH